MTLHSIRSFLAGAVISALALFYSCSGETAVEAPVMIESADSSIVAMNLAIRNDPGNADLYHQRARLLFGMNESMQAFNDMKRAVAIDSTRADYFMTIGDIYLRQGEGGKSLQAFKHAAALEPENAEAWLKASELNLYMNDHTSAIAMADEVLKQDPHNAQAYFMKGMAFKYAGDTLTALSSFQTAVEQDPAHYKAYMQMGLILADKNDPTAELYLRNALNLDPSSTEALYALGMLKQNNGLTEEATALYQNILLVDSLHRDALFNLGYVHLELLDQPEEAGMWFNKLVGHYPEDASGWYMKGYASERAGNFTAAAAAYKRSLSISPQYDLPAYGLERIP